MEHTTDARRAEVVEFWRTVEMFSPQKVDKADREKLMFTVHPDRPLPWEENHDLAQWSLRSNQMWRHVVYLGIHQLDEVFDVLTRLFPAEKESYEERPSGDTAVAAFVVDEHGYPVLGSEVLASCAWATGQAVRSGPSADWVAEFQDATMDFSRAWRDVVTTKPSEPHGGAPQPTPRVLDADALAEALAAATNTAGIDTTLSCAEIRVNSQVVSRRSGENTNQHDFLNSFIMRDLNLVAGHTAAGNIGTALRQYLRSQSDIRTTERLDVRDRIDDVFTLTNPDDIPAGRWPSPAEHSLALNQQLAVRSALGLGATGIMGVNGPPGTGKTTMLRDLIASLVVERGRQLAALSAPHDAFTGEQQRWKTGQYTRVVSMWQPEFAGFEVVVASSNNGAVQNVTDEIPTVDAIGKSWRDHASVGDYFSDIATALLRSTPSGHGGQSDADAPAPEAWALLAARLGNKDNRRQFANAFWFHKPDEQHADEDPWSGMLTLLKEYEQSTPDRSWREAVADFNAADKRVESLRAERAGMYRDVERRAQVEHELVELNTAVTAAADQVALAQQRCTDAVTVEREQAEVAHRIALQRHEEEEQALRRRRDEAERTLHAHESEIERIVHGRKANVAHKARSQQEEVALRWNAHAHHQHSIPGVWDWLRTFGAANRRWARQEKWHEKQVAAAKDELHTVQSELDTIQQEEDAQHRGVENAQNEWDTANQALTAGVPIPSITHEPLIDARHQLACAEQELSTAQQEHDAAERARTTAETELAEIDEQLGRNARILGMHYPDASWWHDRERREMTALWTDSEWNTARSELFFASLALHKTFLQHAATEMRRNLQAAMDLVIGEAPRELSEDVALDAWRSLFFVVPVVSTTFASYERVFGSLGNEALGWLLIDEGGQATPQNAVGALWRTKRAIVVGDPLQLEPITTLPFHAEQAIRSELGVAEEWLTSRTSVQCLADRLTPLGTSLPDDDGTNWVGIPLTVHRRCDQPMFDIVNAVAYDGLMINGTGEAVGARFRSSYPTLPESKWIDVTGGTAQGHWIPDEGRQLSRILHTLADLEFDMSEVMVISPFRDVAKQVRSYARTYRGLTAGTIHTAQGKQADVVVVVLGSNPGRPGARQWAASKPNLLNVAVSRAKRRLYVIGDWDAWADQRYFTTLAATLPRTPPIES